MDEIERIAQAEVQARDALARRDLSEVSVPRTAWVLVVDDTALNRSKLRLAVANPGHDVETAASGAQALGVLRASDFDAVLLDIVMPEVVATPSLRRCRAHGLANGARLQFAIL